MLENGEWIAENPSSSVAGFHLSSLYSPVGWLGWSEIAEKWVKIGNDTSLRKEFINTILGEVWQERGEAPDWKRLYDRREDYKYGTAPKGVLIIVVGVDVQKDRLEPSVWGFGRRGRESWLLDREVFEGDPNQPEVWNKLSEFLERTYETETGYRMPIQLMAIDSG